MRAQPSWLDTGGAVPLGQSSARSRNLVALTALIVRLLLREEVGYRLLSWSNIIVIFLALQVLQWFDNVHFGLFTLFGGGVIYGNHTALFYFGVAWAALFIWEHFKRLDEEKQGRQPHTFSPGKSRFGLQEILPWNPKIIAVAVEPGLAFLAGAVMRRLGFSMLGWVFIASALCFALAEWRFFQQSKEHRRDLDDIGLETRWEADLMKQSTDRKPEPDPAATPGLATGIDGLEDSIGKRRQERVSETTRGGAL
jgi:hypothetical protein